MVQYSFNRLIRKYGTTFTVICTEKGHYKAGDWVTGEGRERLAMGAILPQVSRKQYQSGGVLTNAELQLIMLESLGNDLKNIRIKHQDTVYEVEQDTDYSRISNIYIYGLKAVKQ